MNTTKKMICHECGKPMKRDVRPSTITYKGESVRVDQPGWYCTGCKEAVLSGDDMAATEHAFIDLKAKVEGVLAPKEVRAMRQKLGLSQAKASALLGGGPRAFYKYENGRAVVSKPMANLLTLLAKHPPLLNELEGARR